MKRETDGGWGAAENNFNLNCHMGHCVEERSERIPNFSGVDIKDPRGACPAKEGESGLSGSWLGLEGNLNIAEAGMRRTPMARVLFYDPLMILLMADYVMF